jgi:8-oxo-dGTP pyrophosphatase MutT (NUDIX family)
MTNSNEPHGVIDQSGLGRKNDYLYRVSVKGLIKNDEGNVLVVKETNRTWWDLPGGGMDHDETIHTALAREMNEEVGLTGGFTYRVIAVEDPGFLPHANVWQLRMIFEVKPDILPSETGDDGDELTYVNPEMFKNSEHAAERSIYDYAQLGNE